jgi:hypothetical protein
MQQLEEDRSYRERLALYRDFIVISATNVIGQGIGAANLATKLANDGELGAFGIIDSGILETMFVLGWPGTILFAGGLVALLSLAFTGCIPSGDSAARAAGAVVLATFVMTISHNTLVGVGGMVFWSFLGLMLSARMFHLADRPGTLRGSHGRWE